MDSIMDLSHDYNYRRIIFNMLTNYYIIGNCFIIAVSLPFFLTACILLIIFPEKSVCMVNIVYSGFILDVMIYIYIKYRAYKKLKRIRKYERLLKND
jgi:uncharacterized membrane protein